MIRRQLERYGRAVALIVAVQVVALGAAFFILSQERLRSPLKKTYDVEVAFSSVTAVAPGLGEPVNVAGVQVGQISGGKLENGQGVLRLTIDPKKLPHLYANAKAVLVPNSPLKDMQLNIVPGGPPAKVLPDGGRIAERQTDVPVEADDLTAALDTDTRTWLATLLQGFGKGTQGRAHDLNRLFRAMGPTTEQVHDIAGVLAQRRHAITRLVHNLRVLTTAAGSKDREIRTVVQTGNATLRALAGQDRNLRSTVALLPGTVAVARRSLVHATALADTLRPTLLALLPSVRRLEPTLRDSRQVVQGGGLLPVKQVRPFVDAILPVAQALPPTVKALTEASGPNTTAFKVIGEFTNELTYRPSAANPGFLYWLPWFAHNFNSATSTRDANGGVIRGLAEFSCSTLSSNAQIEAVLGPLLQNIAGCNG